MDRFFALTVTDALPDDMILDRISRIMMIAAECTHLGRICIRNDSGDGERFARVAATAAGTGIGTVLESSDPLRLREAASAAGDCILRIIDPSGIPETAMLSNILGCPMTVPGRDVQELMDNAELADSYGADIILDPAVNNMKSCLETNTDIHRLSTEHGITLAGRPLLTRVWSGEYALSVASVSVMRYGTGIVLDDLDLEGCRILDRLMSVQKD